MERNIIGGAVAHEGAGSISRIALIGNFLPRRCGIATFTTHVHAALCERYPDVVTDVYAMNDRGHSYPYPPAVVGTIDQEDLTGYRRVAAAIEQRGTDLIWVQHEFGIFGGAAGRYLLTLLDCTTLPVIVTLHTILSDPNPDQRAVMERLLDRASLVVVMARRAQAILRATYGDLVGEIAIVPHGIPERAYEEPGAARRRQGLEDRQTIMTFGLLSPDKGIETMIRAMPRVLGDCPDAIYRIVGATHPHLLAHEGEAHRVRLEELADSLGVASQLRWDNRFLDEAGLLEQLAAADLYVTPYRNPAQITSGALSYAAGLGKPIVSTPYVHAVELLAEGRGSLVPFDEAEPMAEAIIALMRDESSRRAMAFRIYRHSRGTTWPRMVGSIIGTAQALISAPAAGADAEARDRQGAERIAA